VKNKAVFTFIVKNLGFLKLVPLLAFQFDSMLRLWTFFTRRHVLDCIDAVEAAVLTWPGTRRQFHKYGGIQFNYGGREIGHIHGNGILDMRFSRKIKALLMDEGRITDHHVFQNSGWITFHIHDRSDDIYAQKLLRMGYDRIAGKTVG